MGLQKKVLRTLAFGKAGDISGTAFDPIVHTHFITDNPVEYGCYVSDLGILVNPNDSEGISERFRTTNRAEIGQVGSFLQYGICIVKCNQVATILTEMNAVVGDGYDASKSYTTTDDDVCEIWVFGEKGSTTYGDQKMQYIELRSGDNVISLSNLHATCGKAIYVDVFSNDNPGGTCILSVKNNTFGSTTNIATVSLTGTHGASVADTVIVYTGDIINVSGTAVSGSDYVVRLVFEV